MTPSSIAENQDLRTIFGFADRAGGTGWIEGKAHSIITRVSLAIGVWLIGLNRLVCLT